jgi:hypothetical protein
MPWSCARRATSDLRRVDPEPNAPVSGDNGGRRGGETRHTPACNNTPESASTIAFGEVSPDLSVGIGKGL